MAKTKNLEFPSILDMIIRPGGKVKPKSKTRHDIAGVGATPHYSTTSDDIWMKNWGE